MNRIEQRRKRLEHARIKRQYRYEYICRVDRNTCIDPLRLLGAELRALAYRSWKSTRV